MGCSLPRCLVDGAQTVCMKSECGTYKLRHREWAQGIPNHREPWQAELPHPQPSQAPVDEGASALRGAAAGVRVGGQTHAHSADFSLCASDSWLPRASVRLAFQPQAFPRRPQRKRPRPGAPPGSPRSCWLPSRRLGASGLASGSSSVWFSPSCPGTSDARLAVKAPIYWGRYKAPTQLAAENCARGT